MNATGAVLFFVFFAVLLLAGLGLYFRHSGVSLSEAWDSIKTRLASHNARVAEARSAQEREVQLRLESALSPGVAVDKAVERMTREGWALQQRSETTATFAREEKADSCMGCFLLLFGILPGILYGLLGGRTVRVTLAAYATDTGSRLVVGGDDRGAIHRLTTWLHELPAEGKISPPPGEPEHLAPSSGSLSDRLHELSEAWDAGLITSEEFEIKKKELLERM